MNNNIKYGAGDEHYLTDGINIDELSYAIDCGKINMETLAILTERISEEMRREAIVKRHNHTIWQDKSGRWNTYIDDAGSKRGYKKTTRNSRKDILDELIYHYKVKLETVEFIKEQWIQYKRENERIKEQSLMRYENDYNRFFSGTKFEQIPISEVTESQIRTFIVQNIKEKKLTAKTYAGLRLLINGIFKFAKQEGKTKISISNFFADLDVHGMCQPPARPQEAYSEFEIKKIIKECEKCGDVIALCIILDFQIGARISETVACRWSDVNFKHATLSINGTAVTYKDPITKKRIHRIQDMPKTFAGERVVFLTDSAVETLHKLYKLTGNNEFICSDVNDGHIIESNTLRKRLEKVCNKIGVEYRATHAARRTMGTMLLNSDMPEDLVRKQMGHSDIATTRKYYNRDRTEPDVARSQLNRIINY